MANKRMFSLEIVDTDKFMGLSLSAQALYFHLGMRADDDGFVSVTKKIMFFIGCSQKELKQLVDNGFVIPFESGIVVITDWKKQNYIQKDRYKPTVYTEERSCLDLINNKYHLKNTLESALVAVQNGVKKSMDTECIHDVYITETQYSLGEDSLGKVNIDKVNIKGEQSSRIYYPEDEKLDRAFKDYIEMRKKMKPKPTDRAIELAMKKLKKLATIPPSENMDNDLAIKILEESVLNGWKGLFPLKENSNRGSSKGSSRNILDEWENA